jgi:diguanylate cyclase (GGDEF)-like protein
MGAMHPEDLTDTDLAAVRKGLAGGYSIYYDPGDDQYCFVMPVEYGSIANGAILISMEISTLTSEIKKSALTNITAALIASVLIGMSLYFLFRALFTKRVQAVSAAAVGLAAGDMKARAEVSGTDEIGYLATSFNVMTEEITNWRANLEEMVELRVKDLSILYSVAEATSQSLELDTMLPIVLQRVLRVMGEEQGLIYLREGDAVRLAVHRGFSSESVEALMQLQPGEGYAGAVMAGGRTIRIGDVSAEKDFTILPGLDREGIRAAIVAPIAFQQKNLGAVALYSRRPDRFSENDEDLFQSIGNLLGVAVENAKLYEKTLELAQVDALTGLPNRRHLMETLMKEVERAQRYTLPLSVLFLDLDRFKAFNDTYGHLAGDALLREFGAALRKHTRTTDMAGRYGGEEFAVVLTNTPLQGAITAAERIRVAAEQAKVPVKDRTALAGTTVSIGAAELREGQAMEDLLRSADAALYRAKEEGRNRVKS